MRRDDCNGTNNCATRERLLDAAGEVFAQRGFRSATIREISQRAGANVAAINYYFGDKRKLYDVVLEHSLRSAIERFPPDLDLHESPAADEKLRAFVRSLLFRILYKGRPAWHGKLMAREIAEPTGALDLLVENAIRPLYELLLSIVRDLADRNATDDFLHLCAMSIIGQCLYYHHARHVIARLHKIEFGSADIEKLAEHITRFSIHAVRNMLIAPT